MATLRILDQRTGTQLQLNERERFHFDKHSDINHDMMVQEKDEETGRWRTMDPIEYDIKIKERDNSLKIKKTGERIDQDLDRLVDGIQELIHQFKNNREQFIDEGNKNKKSENMNQKGRCYQNNMETRKQDNDDFLFEKSSSTIIRKNKNNGNDLLSKWKRIANTSSNSDNGENNHNGRNVNQSHNHFISSSSSSENNND